MEIRIDMPMKRLLEKDEAAAYIGITRPKDKRERCKKFDAMCPVHPTLLPGHEMRFDIRDLDKWIDSLKGDEQSVDDILERL